MQRRYDEGLICSCQCQEEGTTAPSLRANGEVTTTLGLEASTVPDEPTSSLPHETTRLVTNLDESLTSTAASEQDVSVDKNPDTTLAPSDSPVVDTTTSSSDTTTSALGTSSTVGVATTAAPEDTTHFTTPGSAGGIDTSTTSNEPSFVTGAVQEQTSADVSHEPTVTTDDGLYSTSVPNLPPNALPELQTTVSPDISQQPTTPQETTSSLYVTSSENVASDTRGADPVETSSAGSVTIEPAKKDDESVTTSVAEKTTEAPQDVSRVVAATTTEVQSSPEATTAPSIAEEGDPPTEGRTTTVGAEVGTATANPTTASPTGGSEGNPTVTTNVAENIQSSTETSAAFPTTDVAQTADETDVLHLTTPSSKNDTTTTQSSEEGREGRGDVAATPVSDREVSTPAEDAVTENSEGTTVNPSAEETTLPTTTSSATTAQQISVVPNTTVITSHAEGTVQPTEAETVTTTESVQHTTASQVENEQSSTDVSATTTLSSSSTVSIGVELLPGDTVPTTTEGTPEVTTPVSSENTIASELVKPTSIHPLPTTVEKVTEYTTDAEGHTVAEGSVTTLPSVPVDFTVPDVTTTNEIDASTTTGTTQAVQSEPIGTTTTVPVDSAPNDPEVTTGEGVTSTTVDMTTPALVLGTEAAVAATPSTESSELTTASATVEDGTSTPPSETTISDLTTSGGTTVVMGGPSGDTTTTNVITEPSLQSTTVYASPDETTWVPTGPVDQTTTEGGVTPVIAQETTTPRDEVILPIATTETTADENDTSINVIVGSRNPKHFSVGETTVPVSPDTAESTTTVHALSTPVAPQDVTETTNSHPTTHLRSWFLNYTSSVNDEETTAPTAEDIATQEDNEVPDLLSTLFPELYGISSAAATILAAHDTEETTTTDEPSSTEPAASTDQPTADSCDYREDLTVSCLLPEELNNTVTVEFSTWNHTQAEAFRTVVTERLSEYCMRVGIPLVEPRVVFIKSDHGMDMLSFFVVNQTRGSVVPSRILLPFLNETRPTLEDAVKLSISNAFYGLPLVKEHDEALARAGIALNLIYIIIAACCTALVILIVCILTLVKCRSTSHKYSPDSEKLSKDMALRAEIGDLRPSSEILKEEAQMKDTAAAINGNGTHLTKENDGWVVPFGQVPVETKNGPDNQDTKL
ncbi:mucin-2-like isoform X2 [Ornithodoros turicata]|uniref:mucin-2-like isoform X2 n=1 Tax=Ornithodoros turicata TaxID=34597 RepID=UPI00313A193C